MPEDTQKLALTLNVLTTPNQIYQSFTSAEGWCSWCCETAEIDAKVGGELHIFTEGYNAYGEFIALEPDRIIEFTWLGDDEPPTQIRVLVSDLEGQTKITYEVSILDSEQDWDSFIEFLERTWGHALANLKNVLEEQPAS